MPDDQMALKKIDTVGTAIKNNKVRQHIQQQVAGNTDKRVGTGEHGPTRWSTRHKQIETQLKLRNAMRSATEDEDWKVYFDDDETSIIRDSNHWEKLGRMKRETATLQRPIKILQGTSSLNNTQNA